MKLLIGALIVAALCMASVSADEQIPSWAQGNFYDDCIISNVTYTYGNGTPYDVVTYGLAGNTSSGEEVCYIPHKGGGGNQQEFADSSVEVPEFGAFGVVAAVLAVVAMVAARRVS